MKKLLSLSLTLTLLFTVVFYNIASADTTELYINQAIAGNELTAIISIENNQGFTAFSINVSYDKDILTPISITGCELIKGKGDTITSNISGKTYTADFVSAVWVSLNEIKDNGNLFEVKFRLKEDFSANETSIKVTCNELISKDKTIIELAPKEAKVNLSKPNTGIGNVPDKKPTIMLKKDADKIRYMNDYGDEFKPLTYATRYEVVDALYSLFDFSNVSNTSAFSDVLDEYTKQVCAFTSVNVVLGYPDGTFRGNNNITRAEFIKLLTTAFNFYTQEISKSFFTDIEDSWAKNYINAFALKGYAKGYENSDGTYSFRPDDFVTRSECVAFINRIISASGELSDKKYTDLSDSFWGYGEIMKVVK